MLGFTKHTQLTRFVDFVAAQAEISGGSGVVPVNTTFPTLLRHLAPILRGVVFLGQFRVGADCEGQGLRAVSFDNYVISRFIGLRPAKLNASHTFRQCHKVPALFRRCGGCRSCRKCRRGLSREF